MSMGILQARILEWVALPSSRGSSQPRDWTQAFCIAGGFSTIRATREAQEYWSWSPGYWSSLLRPRNQTRFFCIAGRFFTSWATREAQSSLDSVLKGKDITWPTKVHIVKAMVFPVVMYGRESWNIKKAEHQRIDAFELWCWRRFLRVPWAARRSKQSILKEINPEYSLERLMLKLKLQYFGHLMQATNSLEETLM